MADPFTIQRVPRGLNDVLSIFGGRTPQLLGAESIGVIELLQFYGSSQLQTRSASNAALTQGSSISIPVPANEVWILFSAAVLAVRTGTMTAMAFSIRVGASGSEVAVAAGNASPYAATALGAFRLPYSAPFPRLLLPGSSIVATLDSLGTDANANVLLSASVGVMG